MTRITFYNVKRAVTPIADNSELWFLRSSHHIMVIYICIKFQENISDSFQVREITIFNVQMDIDVFVMGVFKVNLINLCHAE